MKRECEVVRDLLPLYADGVCSETSRDIVAEHLKECPECSAMLGRLQKTELENDLRRERNDVIEYGARRFRRRSAAVGSAVSGLVTLPVLAYLALYVLAVPRMGWYYVVLAALLVAASVIAVPLLVREDRLFWTFCAFTASLMVLLGVICLYVHGHWFWIASSATLFGLSAVFLPFGVRSRPVKRLIGDSNPVLIVLGVDFALFLCMLNMISARGRITGLSLLFTAGIIAGVALVAVEIARNRRLRK